MKTEFKLLPILLFLLVALVPLNAQSAEAVHKSPNDPRAYRYLELDNGLKVMLARDPELSSAAASLTVNVGAFQDPDKFQGLAHYLEHMIFMGSDKYEPNALKAFVEANGGNTNAFTGADITTYYFSVDAGQFEPALDRFSAAVNSPTFAPDMARKEVNAVNAEWRSRFETDQFVIQRVNSATLNPKHPLTKLGVGNERTLGQHSDKTLLEAVKTFYRQYYSSDRMTLSLVGPQSFKQLQSLARQHFGRLPKREVPDTTVTEPAFSKDSLAQHIYVKSKVKGDLMVLQFPLEDNQHQWPYQPNQYLHHLLSSVEEGTFYHRMDELGYLNGYQVYLMPQAFVSQGTANIILPLTEKGAANKNQILSAFFNYVELIKRQGIDKAFAHELKRLLNRQFEDFKAPGASQLARHLTMELQKLPPEHVMHAQHHFAEFKPDLIKAALTDITPQSLRLWHISEDQQAATKVPDAQGYYSVKPFTDEDYTAWQPSAELALALPEPQQQQDEVKVVKSDADLSTPQLVHQQQGARAFLAHSQHHQGREGIVSLVINSALPMQNVQNLVYANILGNIYYRDNQRLMQRAQRRAGTQLAVQMGEYGDISLIAAGRSYRHGKFIEDLLGSFNELELDQSKLDRERKFFIDQLNSVSEQKITAQLQYLGMTITERSINVFSDEAKLAALQSATLDGLKQYYQALKGANFIDVFAFGNYSTEDIGALTATARELLGKDHTSSYYRYQSDFKVGPQQALTLSQDISQSDVGLLDFYIYPEKDDSIAAQFRVINSLFANALFTELRTNQQLGYVANSSVQSVHDYPAFVIMLESDNTDLKTLKLKAMSFIREFEPAFAGIGAEVIDKAKQAAINELTKKPENLFVEAMPFLQDWSQGRLNFDTVENQVTYIEQTTHQQLQDLYRQFFLNAHYTNASVQLRGKDFADTAYFQWQTAE